MRMEDLPEELLQEVFLHIKFEMPGDEHSDYHRLAHILTEHERLHTLFNISLTSRACNRAVQRALYNTLDLTITKPLMLPSHFVERFAKRPNTANFVEHLVLGWCEDKDIYGTNTYCEKIMIPRQYTQIASQVGLPAAPPPRPNHATCRDTAQQVAEIAILIYACRNLRHLTFYAPDCWEASIVNCLLGEYNAFKTIETGFANQARPCARVSTIDFIPWAAEPPDWILPDWSHILNLPTLHTVYARNVLPRGTSANCYSEETPVRKISLTASLAHSIDLTLIIEACPGVEAFALNGNSPMTGHGCVDYATIDDAISTYGPRLVEATLEPHFCEHCSSYTCKRCERTGLGPLDHLTSLKHLSVAHEALFYDDTEESEDDGEIDLMDCVDYLVDRLPTSLETLRVTCSWVEYAEVHDTRYASLMEDASFGALQSIEIERDERFTDAVLPLHWIASRRVGTCKYWDVWQVLTRRKKGAILRYFHPV